MDDPHLPQQMPVTVQIIVMAILSGGLLSWIWIIARKLKGQPLLAHEPRRPVPWEGADLAMILIVFLVISASAISLAKNAAGIEVVNEVQTSPALLAAGAAAALLSFLFGVVWVKFRAKATLLDMGIQPGRVGDDVAIGFIAFLASAPWIYFILNIVNQWLPYNHRLIEAIKTRQDQLTLGLVAVTAVVIAPVVEEFFFRVLLQGWLEKLELALRGTRSDLTEGTQTTSFCSSERSSWCRITPGFLPIVASSITFAALHWGQGAAPIPLFVFALVLGWLYYRTHRLLPSVIAHLLLNLNSVAMMVLSLDS